MSSPYGHGMQYLQSLQGIVFSFSSACAARSRAANSAGEQGFSGENVTQFSSMSLMRVMPESTVITFGWDPQKRNAHFARESAGARGFSSCASAQL